MPGGMIIGTCSNPIPGLGFTETTNIDVALAKSTMGYRGYMLDDTLVDELYSGVPDDINSWRWTSCAGSEIWLVGGDLNDATQGGDPSDPNVIIQLCQNITSNNYKPHVYVDDIAILIY